MNGWLSHNASISYFVFTLIDASGNPHQYCLACYRIPDGFEPTIVSHGNSKSGRPFYPTLPSTMEQIRQTVLSKGPKEVLAAVSATKGGITAQESCQEMKNK